MRILADTNPLHEEDGNDDDDDDDVFLSPLSILKNRNEVDNKWTTPEKNSRNIFSRNVPVQTSNQFVSNAKENEKLQYSQPAYTQAQKLGNEPQEELPLSEQNNYNQSVNLPNQPVVTSIYSSPRQLEKRDLSNAFHSEKTDLLSVPIPPNAVKLPPLQAEHLASVKGTQSNFSSPKPFMNQSIYPEKNFERIKLLPEDQSPLFIPTSKDSIYNSALGNSNTIVSKTNLSLDTIDQETAMGVLYNNLTGQIPSETKLNPASCAKSQREIARDAKEVRIE